LLIKLDSERHYLSEIVALISKILLDVGDKLRLHNESFTPSFESGYMFVEKKYELIDEAIAKAYKQANMMAEKRIQSEYMK
jgi:hypothetical protein